MIEKFPYDIEKAKKVKTPKKGFKEQEFIRALVFLSARLLNYNPHLIYFPLCYTNGNVYLNPLMETLERYNTTFLPSVLEKQDQEIEYIEHMKKTQVNGDFIKTMNKSFGFMQIPVADIITIDKYKNTTEKVIECVIKCLKINSRIHCNQNSAVFNVTVSDKKHSFDCIMKIQTMETGKNTLSMFETCVPLDDAYDIRKDEEPNNKKEHGKMVYIQQNWMEPLVWAATNRNAYYGHFNFSDPYTSECYTAIFMPKYHRTFHEHFEEIVKNKQCLAEDEWANITISNLCQIIFVKLLRLKNKYHFCHNDFKADNIAYNKSKKNQFYYQELVMKRKNLLKITKEVGIDLLFVNTIDEETVSVMTEIETNGRNFDFIDFGWTSFSNDENLTFVSATPSEIYEGRMVCDNMNLDIVQLCCSIKRLLLVNNPSEKINVSKKWDLLIDSMEMVSFTDKAIARPNFELQYNKWSHDMYREASMYCSGKNLLNFYWVLLSKIIVNPEYYKNKNFKRQSLDILLDPIPE